MQTNVVEEHHTCTTCNGTKAKSNSINVVKIHTSEFRQGDSPFCPICSLRGIRITIIDTGSAVESDIHLLGGIGRIADILDCQRINTILGPVAHIG